jgi:hypothetical protein
MAMVIAASVCAWQLHVDTLPQERDSIVGGIELKSPWVRPPLKSASPLASLAST